MQILVLFFQAATSTLLTYFLELMEVSQKIKDQILNGNNVLHVKVPAYYGLNKLGISSIPDFVRFSRINDIFTFAFVRHPFER
jgi:hypothetical protein